MLFLPSALLMSLVRLKPELCNISREFLVSGPPTSVIALVMRLDLDRRDYNSLPRGNLSPISPKIEHFSI
jgi:hypothetical protein